MGLDQAGPHQPLHADLHGVEEKWSFDDIGAALGYVWPHLEFPDDNGMLFVSVEDNTTMHNHTAAEIRYKDDSFETMTTNLMLNAIICTVLLFVFSFCVRTRLHAGARRGVHVAPRLPDDPPLAPFVGWAIHAWRDWRSEDPSRPTPCTDGIVIVRFCELGFKFSLAGTLLSAFLLPLYATGHGDSTGFNKYNLSNLLDTTDRGTSELDRNDRDAFRFVVASAYLLVGFLIQIVEEEWKTFIKMRLVQFRRTARGEMGPGPAQALRSLLVERVPRRWRTPERVRKFFEELFPGVGDGHSGVHSCVVQKDTREINKRTEEILQQPVRHRCQQLSAAVCGHRRSHSPSWRGRDRLFSGGDSEHSRSESPVHSADLPSWQPVGGSLKGSLGAAVNATAVGAARVLQDASIGHYGSDTAFVTLRSTADRVIAEQLVLSHGDKMHWQVRGAPEAAGILWRNAPVPLTQSWARVFIIRAGLILGIIFWSVPVTAIQGFANLDNLCHRNGPINQWIRAQQADNPTLFVLLKSYLPVLALIGLLYMLPFAFDFCMRLYEGHKVKAEILRTLLNRYKIFQVGTLYVTVLSGSVFRELSSLLAQPSLVFGILGTHVPPVSCYFINYVLARAGMSIPLLLLFPALNLFDCTATKDANGRKVVRPFLEVEAAHISLVFVLGLTYCIIAPAIMPACAVYFLHASMVYRWLFLYVYEPEFDCGGAFWVELFHGIMIAALLGTLVLAALAWSYRGTFTLEFLAMVILALIVVAAHITLHICRNVPSRFVSLEVARAADREVERLANQNEGAQNRKKVWTLNDMDENYYLDPAERAKQQNTPEDLEVAQAWESSGSWSGLEDRGSSESEEDISGTESDDASEDESARDTSAPSRRRSLVRGGEERAGGLGKWLRGPSDPPYQLIAAPVPQSSGSLAAGPQLALSITSTDAQAVPQQPYVAAARPGVVRPT